VPPRSPLARTLGWSVCALLLIVGAGLLLSGTHQPKFQRLIHLARDGSLVGLVAWIAFHNRRTENDIASPEPQPQTPPEENHRSLFESLTHGVVYQDPEGRIIAANPSATRILGLSTNELTGRTSQDPRWNAIHPDGTPFPGDSHPAMASLRTGQPVQGTLMGLNLPGESETRWLHIDALPEFKPGEPRPFRVLVVFTNISEQIRAEEALRTSQEKFARTFRASPDAFVISTANEGRIVEVNPAVSRITGFPRDELIGKDPAQARLWLEETQRQEYVTRLRNQGSVTNFSARFRTKSGEIVDGLVSGELIELAGAPHFLSVLRDITEWKVIQEDLLATTRTSHDIVQSIPAGLFIYRFIAPDQLVLLSANPAAERLTGIRIADWQGREFNEIWPAARAAGITDRYLDVARTGKPFDSDVLDYADDKLSGSFWMRVFPLPESRLAVAFENTTARRAAERALRENEALLRESDERFSQLAGSIDEAFWIITADYSRIEYVSPAYEQIWGRPCSELHSHPNSWLEALLPEDRLVVEGDMRKRIKGTQSAPECPDCRIRRPDGSIRWIRTRIYPIRNAAGEVFRFAGVAEDITATKRSAFILEARLRLVDYAASHSLAELLRATLDEAEALTHSSIGFYHFLEPDQSTLSLQAWSSRTTREMCSAKGAGQHYPVKEAGVWADAIRERRPIIHNDYASLPNRHGLPEGHAPISRQLVVPVMRGTAITAILGVGNKSSDYVAEDLELVATLADVAWDIAERKRAEEALRLSEARFRDITFTMADWVWEVDAQGRYTFVSDSVVKVLGLEAAGIIGLTPFDLMPPEEAARVRAKFEEVTHQKLPFSDLENTNLHRDGSLRHLLTSGVPILAPNGALLGYRGCDRDITDRKRLEQQYLRAQRLESIGALASGIAHDLNNVLAPILMSVEMLKDSLSGLEDRAMLDMLKTSAHRGAGIVRQLLVFARGSETHRTRLKTSYLVREISKIAAETFPRSIRFRSKLAPDLLDLNADSTQVHQVLLNLCVNARDAMPNGGQLTLSADNAIIDEMYVRMNPDAIAGDFVRLSVADTGVGIPAEVLDKIFEPFFTTKPQGQGTGLGLATVQSIVRNHGGFLEVSSRLREGTEFHIYLPALPPDASEPVAPPTETSLPKGHGETILVVDDEDPIRNAATSILAKHGYRPLPAIDGAEALTLFARNQDTVKGAIIDMMMPLMDGPTTITALRRIMPNLPVVAMSGLPDQERAARGATETHLRFLQKPFTAEILLQTLQEVLHQDSPTPSPPTAAVSSSPALVS
jgi:PAS domain S-box-containing protein